MNLAEIPAAQLTRGRALDAIAVLRGLLVAGHPLLVAYSGGKDSTVALSLTLSAALDLKRTGASVPPVVVTHGDTGIENPSVVALVAQEMEKVREFGRRHGLTLRAEVAHPALNDTWAVSVLSGRKLPTFANSASRDCTLNYKISPMVRLRKALLSELSEQAGLRAPAVAPGLRPITVIGTRFEESEGRAARMAERQESAVEPWEKDGALFLSPIADWTADDVWELLGEMRGGSFPSFTNGADVFDLYATAGGTSCAVVADMATEGAKKSRACGARFGCSLCAAVGRDKSLENMLEADPGYAWLRGLNKIQRFLVDTQYDFARRNWLGRTLDADGFMPVTPDTYSPRMLAELLRYCLTVDADERQSSAQAGLPKPRFELISPQAIVAIDALWGLHGVAQRPFAAISIWLDVHEQGNRYYPPAHLVPFPVLPFPPRRYIEVEGGWDEGAPLRYTGLRDVLMELASDERSPNRALVDGREILELQESALFEVDPDGAAQFLAWEAERLVADARTARSSPTRAFFYYAELGVLSTSKRHTAMLDAIVRRTNWKLFNGLTGEVPLVRLRTRSMSRTERDERVVQREASREAAVAPSPPEQLPLRMRLCHPVYL